MGQKEGKTCHVCAKKDPEDGWLEECEDTENKWKGLCPKIGKYPGKKKKKWIHSHICTEPGQAHPLPSSLSPPSVTSLLELLLLPPPLSLLCPWSPLIYVLSRLQRKFRVTIAKQMPATSGVAFKHLRVWGESKESEKVTPIRALTCMALHGMRESYMDKMSIGRTRPCWCSQETWGARVIAMGWTLHSLTFNKTSANPITQVWGLMTV